MQTPLELAAASSLPPSDELQALPFYLICLCQGKGPWRSCSHAGWVPGTRCSDAMEGEVEVAI